MTMLRRQPELFFTLAFAAVTVVISIALQLPIILPDLNSTVFVGMHYLYPLLGLAVWTVVVLLGKRDDRAWTFLLALPCYTVILICHFNIKLWAPHINPVLWDAAYWKIDVLLAPLVASSMTLRSAISFIVPVDSAAYLYAFIAIFYASFCYHAIRTPAHFRKLVLGALLVQGFGALSYLVAPALGPFLYQAGVEPHATEAQLVLLEAYRANVAGGADWLSREGGSHFTLGLAAMPSLHAGCTFLFVLFARRYAQVLVPFYYVLFGFILVTAVASRWHYLIDLPVGMTLAWCCYRAAHWLLPDHQEGAQAKGAQWSAAALIKLVNRQRLDA